MRQDVPFRSRWLKGIVSPSQEHPAAVSNEVIPASGKQHCIACAFSAAYFTLFLTEPQCSLTQLPGSREAHTVPTE